VENQTSSTLLLKLTLRLKNFLDLGVPTWAGCSSEEHPGEKLANTAYVFEPRISVRTSKEARALVLVLAREGVPDAVLPLLIELQDRFSKRKEPVYIRLNIAIQFLVDRRFHPDCPTRKAIEGIMNYKDRSFQGNDLRLATEVLRRSELKIRALQRSKVQRGFPKRPKERAEPAHEWLPGWEKQIISENLTFEEEEDPIWDLLSPTEVAGHFGRTPH